MKHLLTAILLLAFAHTAAGERNVSLERDFGTLYGTLLTPDAGTETVAVIIAGSGPTPRNGNVNSYLYLAQALEKAGIASLRGHGIDLDQHAGQGQPGHGDQGAGRKARPLVAGLAAAPMLSHGALPVLEALQRADFEEKLAVLTGKTFTPARAATHDDD